MVVVCCRCWQWYDSVLKWWRADGSCEEREWWNPSCFHHREAVIVSSVSSRAATCRRHMWRMWGRSAWCSLQVLELPGLRSVQQMQGYRTAQWASTDADWPSATNASGELICHHSSLVPIWWYVIISENKKLYDVQSRYQWNQLYVKFVKFSLFLLMKIFNLCTDLTWLRFIHY